MSLLRAAAWRCVALRGWLAGWLRGVVSLWPLPCFLPPPPPLLLSPFPLGTHTHACWFPSSFPIPHTAHHARTPRPHTTYSIHLTAASSRATAPSWLVLSSSCLRMPSRWCLMSCAACLASAVRTYPCCPHRSPLADVALTSFPCVAPLIHAHACYAMLFVVVCVVMDGVWKGEMYCFCVSFSQV